MAIELKIDFSQIFSIIQLQVKTLLSKFGISHLLLISLALHLFVICFPNDGGMIFDEVHYITATRSHMDFVGVNIEHTPLVKVFMAFVFRIFGDYWFSWRFPIVISCMIAYIAFYNIAKHFFEEKYALMATAFLCFDTMFFVHGTIYLLDMPAIMFGMVSVFLFLKQRYGWSALTMALSILSKEITVLYLGFLGIYAFVTNIKQRKEWKQNLKKTIKYFGIVIIVGFLFMTAYDNIYKVSTGTNVVKNVQNNIVQDEFGNPITTEIKTTTNTYTNYINNPIEHLKFFFKYHAKWMVNLNSTYRTFQKPWNWIAPFEPQGILDHPVYFSVRVSVGDKSYNTINWRGQGTIPIWYSFWLILPMSIFMLVKKKDTKLNVLMLSWIVVTYFTWVILELFKNSTGFNYYFIYTVPVLCLGIPYFWKVLNLSTRTKTIGLSIHLLATLCFFVYYFPVGLIR